MGTRGFRSAGLAALTCIALTAVACSGGTGAATPGTPESTAGGHPTAATTPATAPTTGPTATPRPALELLWEAEGKPSPKGSDPDTYSPAVDPLTGDVWVAVSFDSIIWIFGPDGKFKDTFGKPGKGDGEFDFVRPPCTPCGAGAMAFAPDGTLFVADEGSNQRIQKFDSKHRFVKAWGSFGAGEGQFADANQIATDGKFVYVSDDARYDLQVFDMDGTFVRGVDNNGWLAIDPKGGVFVSNSRGVTKYAAGAASVEATYQLPDYSGAERVGLTTDGAGHLYFNIQGVAQPYIARGLGEFDIATGKVREWASGGETIMFDPKGGAIYAANFVNPQWPKPTLRKYAIPAP